MNARAGGRRSPFERGKAPSTAVEKAWERRKVCFTRVKTISGLLKALSTPVEGAFRFSKPLSTRVKTISDPSKTLSTRVEGASGYLDVLSTRVEAYAVNNSVDRYRSPVSGSNTTMFFPSFSGSVANAVAAYTAAPDEIPTKTPSSRANSRAVRIASSPGTVIIWSTTPLS